MKLLFSLLAGASLTASISSAADWPQWRGPNRDDISAETGLLKQWPATGPKRAWLFENAGQGYSSFSIAAGKVFTIGTRDGKEILLALDANSGKEIWTSPFDDILGDGRGDGPRGTPTVDADRVYAISGKGKLVCAEAATGKVLWTKSMQELGGKTPHWGYSESPLVDGKLILATPGGEKGTMAAFDKMTGALAWQTAEITEGAQYSSIIPATLGGKKQYVQLVMQTLFGVDPESGKVLWRSPWTGRTAVVPTPILKGDEIFITTGYGVGCKKVKVSGGTATDVFMNKDLENHHGGEILVGDYLYGHSNKDGWTCMSFADGSVKWREKSAFGKGAVAFADGMLYCLEEKTGNVAIVEASPTGWSEKGRFKLEPQSTIRSAKGEVWTHPVIANGKLYLRDQNYIYCYDVRQATP